MNSKSELEMSYVDAFVRDMGLDDFDRWLLLLWRLPADMKRRFQRFIKGKEFRRLTVVDYAGGRHGKNLWKCRCKCGKKVIVPLESLTSGDVESCGCKRVPYYNSQLYRTWREMRRRCSDAKRRDFRYYGGRGIRVCERWQNSFEAFLEDMGQKPDGLTLERINNDGNYEPGNCRWATRLEQNNNRSSSIFITFNKTTKTRAEWALFLGVHPQTLAQRFNRGWSVKRALTQPVQVQAP